MNKLARLTEGDPHTRNLPLPARMKLGAMSESHDAARAKASAAFSKAQEAQRVADSIAADIARVSQDFGARVATRDARREIERLEADKATAQKEANARHVKGEAFLLAASAEGGCFNRLVEWLEERKGASLVSVPMPAAKRVGKETWNGAVERVRQRLAELKAERGRIIAAPLPSALAKAVAVAQVEALAAKGKPDVSPCFEGEPARMAGEHRWDENHKFDPRYLLAWFDPAQMIARLSAQIDAEADDASAMSPKEKAAALPRIEAEIIEVEREEEALISAGAEDATFIVRREDADPRAVLSLSNSVPGYAG